MDTAGGDPNTQIAHSRPHARSLAPCLRRRISRIVCAFPVTHDVRACVNRPMRCVKCSLQHPSLWTRSRRRWSAGHAAVKPCGRRARSSDGGASCSVQSALHDAAGWAVTVMQWDPGRGAAPTRCRARPPIALEAALRTRRTLLCTGVHAPSESQRRTGTFISGRLRHFMGGHGAANTRN